MTRLKYDTYYILGCSDIYTTGSKAVMSTRILIADDDPIQRRSLEAAVLRMGHRTILADGGISALNFIGNRKDIALILLDLTMPDMDGCAVLTKMREAGINIPVIALVQNDDMEKAMQAIRLGAVDFMTKPVVVERMQVSVANAFKLDLLTQELKRTRSSQKSHILLSEMVTKSPEMEKVAALARRVTPLDTPLLIEEKSEQAKKRSPVPSAVVVLAGRASLLRSIVVHLRRAMPTRSCSDSWAIKVL